MSSQDKMVQLAVTVRNMATKFRTQADLMDRYSCMLEATAPLMPEAEAKIYITKMMELCPEYFPS